MTALCVQAPPASYRRLVPSLFFLDIHPTPRSELFPYTTLFRSEIVGSIGFHSSQCGRHSCSGENCERRKKRQNTGDRKSTRLNSSHSQISYAVFCLKKNKSNVETPSACDYDKVRGYYVGFNILL